VVQLGGYVEQPILRSEDGHVRPHRVSEIHGPHHLLLGDVDDYHGLSVGSWLSHAGVAIDGHIGQPPIGRRNNLVARDAIFRDRRDHLARCGVDNGQAPIVLLRHSNLPCCA